MTQPLKAHTVEANVRNKERGQWVMAYVDSNHGASVNDVELLGRLFGGQPESNRCDIA